MRIHSRPFLRAIAAVSLFAVIYSGGPSSFCQQNGMAAKGGSLSRERLSTPHTRNRKYGVALYGPTVRALGFNFSELEETYLAARRKYPELQFETVIIAFIVAEERSPESDELGEKIVNNLAESPGRLSPVLQRMFGLTEEAAKDMIKAATLRLNNAKRVARRAR